MTRTSRRNACTEKFWNHPLDARRDKKFCNIPVKFFPAAGTPVLAADQPSPVHKSAQNLGPLEQMLWAARLQKARDVVASQMKVTVTGGKLVRRYTALDHDDGLFEIQTNKGFYVAVLSKTGEFSIYWRHDRKAY